MNRRIAGRVKQARKRAQRRADIRAGRTMSMQQMLHNQHNHAPEPEAPVELSPAPTHELVYKVNGNVIARGTENEMRRERTKLGAEYTARKIKVAA